MSSVAIAHRIARELLRHQGSERVLNHEIARQGYTGQLGADNLVRVQGLVKGIGKVEIKVLPEKGRPKFTAVKTELGEIFLGGGKQRRVARTRKRGTVHATAFLSGSGAKQGPGEEKIGRYDVFSTGDEPLTVVKAPSGRLVGYERVTGEGPRGGTAYSVKQLTAARLGELVADLPGPDKWSKLWRNPMHVRPWSTYRPLLIDSTKGQVSSHDLGPAGTAETVTLLADGLVSVTTPDGKLHQFFPVPAGHLPYLSYDAQGKRTTVRHSDDTQVDIHRPFDIATYTIKPDEATFVYRDGTKKVLDVFEYGTYHHINPGRMAE